MWGYDKTVPQTYTWGKVYKAILKNKKIILLNRKEMIFYSTEGIEFHEDVSFESVFEIDLNFPGLENALDDSRSFYQHFETELAYRLSNNDPDVRTYNDFDNLELNLWHDWAKS